MASSWPPKKNTAFTLYFTLYKSDGTVIANPGTITKKVSIDGAAVADITASVTEEDTTYGQCSVQLSTSEMNGDAIWVYIKDNTTGCVPFTATLYTAAQTLDEVYSRLGAPAGASLAADLVTIDNFVDDLESRITAARAGYLDALNTGVPVASIASGAITAAAIATDAIDADALKADAVSEIQSGLSTLDAAGVRTAVGLGSANLDTQLADLPTNSELATALAGADDAVLAAIPSAADVADAVWDEASTGHTDAGKAGAQLWTDVDAILADTGELQTNQGDWATATGFSTHSAADVWSVATRTITALDEDSTTIDIDTAVAAGVPAASAVADAVWDEALAGHAGTGSAGAALSAASAPSAADVADAVWDEALSGHAGVGSAGAGLAAASSAGDPWATALPGAYGSGTAGKIIGDNLNATVSSRASQTSVDDLPTNSELATALGSADDLVLAAITGLNDFDPASDVVAHVTLVDTTTTNTDMVDAAPAAADVADAVWDEALAGHAGAGSSGAALSAASAPSAADVADAVWDEALAGHAVAGSSGAALSAAGTAGDPWTTELPGSYAAGTAGKLIGDLPAVKAKTDLISSGDITVTSPVATSGVVTIYAGDDYDATYGRQIDFTITDASHAYGLDDPSASIVLKCTQATWTGTATSTAGGYTVTFEPTDKQTAALTIKQQGYEVEATLADDDVITLATGTLKVVRDIPPVS